MALAYITFEVNYFQSNLVTLHALKNFDVLVINKFSK